MKHDTVNFLKVVLSIHLGALVVTRLSKIVTDISQSLLALVAGLLAGALLMVAYGYDPLLAYSVLFRGAFGSITDFAESLSFAVPLMLTAITFAIGVKAGLFNIGAEGQAYMGAIGAVIAGAFLTLPSGIHLAVTVIFAMLLGALWAVVPALLKITRGVHEVISTIMFNWIAYHLAMYLVLYHLSGPGRAEVSLPVKETARFTVILSGASLTTVIYVAVAFCIATYLFLSATKAGYELKLLGENPDAARYAGVNAKKVVFSSFIIGGFAAGLAGATQVMGRPPTWALYGTLGNVMGLGFDGIGVALIGRNNPIGIIIAAIFFGALANGGRYMEPYSGVCSELVRAINGLIIIALAFPEIIAMIKRYRMRYKI